MGMYLTTILQKKKKFVRLVTETVTVYLTRKSSIYVTLLVLCITVFPFVHNFTYGIEGVFGFTYMSSFLYALSLPVVLICAGLLLLLSKEVLFTNVAWVVMFSGFFYLVYTLQPYQDYPLWLYILVALTVSVFGCIIGYNMHLLMVKTEKKLKHAIQLLISFCIKQYNNAEDEKEYHVNFERVMYDVDDATD